MGKKNKKKKKKVNPKKEKYAKFRKEKPAVVDITPPDRDAQEMKEQQIDDENITRFLRFNRNPPTKEVNERRMKSKR